MIDSLAGLLLTGACGAASGGLGQQPLVVGAGAARALSGETVTFLDYIRAGGVVSYIMIAISIVALTLVIRNLMLLRRSVLAPAETVAALDTVFRSGRPDNAASTVRMIQPPSLLTRILEPALDRCASSPLGFLEFRSAVEESAQTHGDELHRYNDGLSIIAAIGPMLGLLGTVFGMIGAFRTIGALEGAARSNQLSIFMSMALVNTAQGLIIAVPCTVAYALFRRHIDRRLVEIGEILERYVQVVAAANPRGNAPVPAPPPARPQPPGQEPAAFGGPVRRDPR